MDRNSPCDAPTTAWKGHPAQFRVDTVPEDRYPPIGDIFRLVDGETWRAWDETEFWDISHFRYALIQAVKRQQGIGDGAKIWKLYTRWAYPDRKWMIDPLCHNATVLADLLANIGCLQQNDHILKLLQHYDPKDFQFTEWKKEEIPMPAKVNFQSPMYHEALASRVQDLQRLHKWKYSDKLSWGEFHDTFCLGHIDPSLNNPQFLKVYWYHVTGTWWLQDTYTRQGWRCPSDRETRYATASDSGS